MKSAAARQMSPVLRRLTAIVAADVAGYSRLMGADEEGTHNRLKAHLRELIEPKIAGHRGRVVKNTGDGFLAEFASVVDAVRCAVQVQRGMADREPDVPEDRRIRFRVAINVADVIAEERDIFGDGVNIAARLEALAEPGGICVSGRVREDAGGKLDLAFEDLGEQQLKNIAKPVRVFRVRGPEIAGQLIGTGQPIFAFLGKPSVAVLPFTNMSTDPEQECFCDGITEDLNTALSRYPSLFVIARNSSYMYKSRSVDVRLIGRELGVRYVIEGSVRRAGNRLRVTARLVEAESGKYVWAEKYDRELAGIFSVLSRQDKITKVVTIAIASAIADAERRRTIRQSPESL